jgi:hypothetical protein
MITYTQPAVAQSEPPDADPAEGNQPEMPPEQPPQQQTKDEAPPQ